MIEYSAIAESSAAILTIYFLFFPLSTSLYTKDMLLIFLSLARLQLLINFLLFGITIILAVIESFHFFVFLIIHLIFLPFSINYILKSFEYDFNLSKSLKENDKTYLFHSSLNLFNTSESFNIRCKKFSIDSALTDLVELQSSLLREAPIQHHLQ